MVALALRERWIGWRNSRLSDPHFQSWAASFPLTRSIAHRRTAALFDVVAGFVYSQVLAACVQLNLFERLAAGPADVGALAKDLGLPPDATDRLLAAAAALDLVERVGEGRFALGAQGAALLGAAGLREMIAHHAGLYADLADSVGLLQRNGGQGAVAGYWPYAARREAGPQEAAAYSRLMATTQPAVAAEILAAYPVGRHHRLLDVGGGEGAFLEAAGQAAPRLRLMLFDLPAVAPLARARLDAAALLSRSEIHAGDFIRDRIPTGADLMTLIRILHDHDDAGVLAVLRAIRQALPPDGVLLIAEPMSRSPKPDPVCDAYFGMYLFAMGRGRARTPGELMRLLKSAGFRRTRTMKTRTPSLLGIIIARP